MTMAETESDSDDILEGSWSLNKRKKIKESLCTDPTKSIDDKHQKLAEQSKKFEELKRKSSEIMSGSLKRRHMTEVRRSQKLLRKALRDPSIKAAVEGSSADGKDVEDGAPLAWQDVKPYLSINEHLQGPVPHGDCGPKTELEYQIEDCIKEGDFEKAELLSDTLANREFAVKISHAFAAKKCREKEEKEKTERKKEQMKKIRWMFDAKEKWQMKGNM